MASQEEDNKLECISNVNKDQERYFLNVYKKHEYILNNKNETFKSKIESLLEVWKSVGELNLSQFDIRHVIQIMDWAKLHALNIVLTAEWNKFKATYQFTLLQEIEKAQNELLKLNSAFATRCKKLSDVVRNPWEDPVLMTLMKTKDSEIGPEEIEFFCVETAYIVSVRLKKLCESHCEDLALNLVTAFMNCNKLSKSQNFSLNATETQMWFIFDIYIALLYKFQEKQKIVVLLKELTFEEGLQLVKRFAKKRVKISKIWKNCQRVAILATQMYISQAVVKYTEELKEFLESYLEIYISLCSTESLMQEFPTCIRRISNLADAAGLYLFCDVIRKKAGTEMKPLVVEMYIRALTTDMNELERQKDGNETEKATATTSRLAEAFCNLADFLDEHVKVARECVLTAFSLEPTKERLANIETLARRSGFQVLDTGQEWKCKLHPPALPTDDVTWICPECGEWMCKPDFTAPIKINMALNEALQNSVLGISEALCDDLVVCLSNPRYQILSWFLPWADLHRLCIMYLQDSQTTKNFVTELKFVDIDYSIFKGIKREPMDELAGIERGYEQYLDHDFVSDDDSTSNSEDSMSQDSRPYSLGSDGAGEGPYLPMLPPQTKSDPKTLKSLRMFRPSLKRSRDKDPEEGTPEKLFKTDSNNTSDSSAAMSSAENITKTENNNSLSLLLNGATPTNLSAIQYPQLSAVQYPPSSISLTDKSSNKEVSHSKNVKTATLPLLGGQVAKKEITAIQVNKQPLHASLPKMGSPSLLINLVQTVIPQNQLVINNTMETSKTPLNQKSLNKLSQNGLSESNSHKTSDSKSQDYCLPNQESLALTECPLKIQKELQLKRSLFNQMSCPKILTVNLEKLPVDQSQNMMEYKLDQKQSTPIQQADINQSPQNISQTTQYLGQNLPHKLASLEKHLPNQIQLSSPLNLDQSPIPLTKQEKVPTNSSAQKQLLSNPLPNPGLDQSTIQTTLPSTINPLPKNITQCFNLEQVQKEPVRQINPQTNHILDMKPSPKPNQVSTVNQLRIHLVNIEKLKSSSPPSLSTNQNQNRNHSINQEQIQTSQLPNLQTLKSMYLPNQDQVTGDLDHQSNLDQTQNNQVKQEPLQTTQLVPLQTLKSKFHLSQHQVQGNSLHQTHLDNSVKQEHLRATQLPLHQTPKNRPSHPGQIQSKLLHQQSLDQKQKHSTKREQTSQLPSLQQLISNSPMTQDQVPDTLVHSLNLEQEQHHAVKQIIQLPSPRLSKPLIYPENSPITMQTFNSDPSQKNVTQLVDPNLSQKQSNSQEEVEYNQKPSESCFKQQQNQQIKEKVTVNKFYQLQKSHCNSVHVPNQEKQLVRQESLQTSCSLKPLQLESNYTQSPNLGQTKNHQTKQENLETKKEQEDNSKCFSQDPTQHQSANREKLQVSLPLNPPQWQSILKQTPHSEHIHSQMNTIEREKQRETENSQRNEQCQETNSVQHISPEQEVIQATQEKLQTNPIPCLQQFPSNIIQRPPLEQPQSPVSKHQSQDSLSALRTNHRSNSDQSCKVTTNQEKQISHFPNPNQLQNSSCSLLKAPSLSPNLDKLQTSRSIRNNLKTSSNHSLEQASPQLCHNQNNVPLVSPKVGKVPCTLKKLPNPTISMEAEILPSLDKFQSSCTPSLSMETEPPCLEKLQARLWPGLEQADKVMDSNKQQLRELKVVVDKTCQTLNSKESLKSCLEKKSCCTTLEIMERNENLVECDKIVSKLDKVFQSNSDSKIDDVVVLKNDSCDSGIDENCKNVNTAVKNGDREILRNDIRNMFTHENWKNMKTVSNNTSEEIAQQSETKSYNWLDSSSGIFSDLSENKPEELFFQSSMDCATSAESVNMIESHLLEELPKNFNLTENIRTYTKKSRKALSVVNKDCIEALTGDDILNVCKNVNSVDSIDKLHSNVQNSLTKSKELKVVLCRLSSNKKMVGRSTPNSEEHCSIKNKCDRGKTPPKNSRRRRSTDKSENKVDGKAPNLVQNHGLSPLQDINLRANPRVYTRACCDLSVLNTTEDLKQRVLTEQNPANRKSYAKSVLANIPGLNDFQMIKPLNVNHIVNVVQVSGGRPAQNVPLQSSQTSTQVTPHIQRIGQPRISDQKPEHSNSVTSTTHTTTTTTTARTTTTQPSTLINILSQQIIRPVATQANTVRRQTPLINILSQQIIKPSSTVKTANNSTVPVSETNQVKPVVTTEQTVINQVNNVVKNTNSTVKNTIPVTGGQGGTILQFICKSSLPKFQQAFGKTIYQNSAESSESVTATVETTGNVTNDPKKNVTKTVPVNVQPIQGSVIYSRQVPVGQTISLIPPGGTTRQVFRIATSNPEQISLVKDSVIHSKMSALLAAALQGRPKNAEGDIQLNCDEGKGTVTRPTLVQGARIVKPVQLQLQSNTARAAPQPNLSSTTLEQLREFDMVYKQVKERSSTTTNETGGVAGENQEVTQQRISVTYVNQLQKYTQLSPVVVVTSYSSLQPAASPALSVTSQGSSSPCVTPASTPTLPKISSKTSKGKTLKSSPNNTTPKSSPIPKPQQKPQEDEHTTQRIFDILAEYAEQLRNSPDLNNKPAPRRRSNPPTNPSQNSKRKKTSSGVKKSGHTSNSLEIDTDDITVGSEDSSGGGMVQLSVTDDEQSQAATINTTESSDNSSPPSSRQLILTESGNQSRNLIIADSSVGEALKIPNTAVIVPGSYIMPVSMVKGGQQIAVVSGGSKILATVPARSGQNMLLFQSFTNQHRKGAISAVKYSTIQPISGISSQSLAGVSAQPPVILPSNSVATAVALGQSLTLKKIGEDRDSNEQLLLTISPSKEESKDSNDVPQPDSSTSVSSDSVDIKIESDIKNESDNSRERIYQSYQKSVITNSAGTSVIATTSAACIKEEDNTSQNIISIPADNMKAEPKSGERIHSVLVTACSSNGPMLSHITPRYRKPSDTGRTNNNDLPNKEEFLHNGEKTNTDQKNFRTSATYYVNKMKKVNVDSQKLESEMQKQAAIERELRLQKSLSEECEDLGVDEPSTSDLFPEADLLFDSNHSPSFDQTSQDIIKRAPQSSDLKEEVKETMNLFSDDENSSSLRTDLFEYVEYQTVETALARQLMNGNNSAESGSSGCEDNTLLAKCATMSEVTLNSPISPEIYQESSLHKYKFKYSNRKKGERIKQSEFGEVVSSSEDTFGNAELSRINCEEDNFKVVHVAITKTDIVKEGETCELHCDEDLDSPSGRGARRSVRKLCSCCNGSQDGNIAKKRPQTSRPHTPAVPHKKAFLNKKR